MHQLNQDMQNCIRECLNCYEICRRDAMNHCLETGGKHLDPTHFRLMASCAETCRTAADLMLTNSPVHAALCDACADVCAACAASCEQVGDMDGCVQACRRCEQSCRKMSGHGASTHYSHGSQSQTAGTSVRAPM